MTNPQLVAKLLSQGGRVLIVGGQLRDLPPQYHEHPQIIMWDDNKQEYLTKEVPSNVKIIVYTRLISHGATDKLNRAAKDLHAIKFPMLRTREIKELMSEVIPTPVTEPVETTPAQESEETTMPKQEQGALKKFIAKNINMGLDYSVKGNKTREGERLYELSKKEGVKTTRLSAIQGVRVVLDEISGHKKTPKVIRAPKPTMKSSEGVDDFAELDRLLTDAITAMKLIQEHLPKVRQETEKLRGMKAKVLSLFD
jgi:hypothetical protein